MGDHGLHGLAPAAVVAEADRNDRLVAAGVDRVVAALGLDALDCFRFLDAYDALTGIVREIIWNVRSETIVDRTDADDRRP